MSGTSSSLNEDSQDLNEVNKTQEALERHPSLRHNDAQSPTNNEAEISANHPSISDSPTTVVERIPFGSDSSEQMLDCPSKEESEVLHDMDEADSVAEDTSLLGVVIRLTKAVLWQSARIITDIGNSAIHVGTNFFTQYLLCHHPRGENSSQPTLVSNSYLQSYTDTSTYCNNMELPAATSSPNEDNTRSPTINDLGIVTSPVEVTPVPTNESIRDDHVSTILMKESLQSTKEYPIKIDFPQTAHMSTVLNISKFCEEQTKFGFEKILPSDVGNDHCAMQENVNKVKNSNENFSVIPPGADLLGEMKSRLQSRNSTMDASTDHEDAPSPTTDGGSDTDSTKELAPLSTRPTVCPTSHAASEDAAPSGADLFGQMMLNRALKPSTQLSPLDPAKITDSVMEVNASQLENKLKSAVTNKKESQLDERPNY